MTAHHRVLLALASAVSLSVSTALAQVPTPGNVGHPLRGSAKWSAVLCHYNDETPPEPRDYYVRLLDGRGAGGLRDYLGALSRGLFDYDMTVHGWVVIDKPLADRGDTTYGDCLAAAANDGIHVPADHFSLVYTPRDTGSKGHEGIGAHASPSLDGVMHESLHAFRIAHAHSHYVFDYATSKPVISAKSCFTDGDGWRQGVDCMEYGDAFDVMSFGQNFWTNSVMGRAGPLFSAFNLDRMGWLGADEVVTFGARGEVSATYTLRPLYAPGTGGIRAVRVPFNSGDAQQYYLIHLRQSTGWDSGFGGGRPWVLIQEVKRAIDGQAPSTSAAAPQGYLLNDLNGAPVKTVSANGVEIRVTSIAADGSSADVTVTGGLAAPCIYEWRGPWPSDWVCTNGEPDRDLLSMKWCANGEIWDYSTAACVAAKKAVVVPADVVGPNACKGGFVWRQIDRFDFVCVTPQRKALVDWETANAPRPVPNQYRYWTCPSGYVDRLAIPGDFVCVPSQSRVDANADNALAWSRLAYP